jgi:hypothetical protein
MASTDRTAMIQARMTGAGNRQESAMALKRVWTPSGNYSSGGTKRILVIHTMEGFTGANGAKDCAIYFQGNVGASSQVCIDNNRGTIWECVSRSYGSWTQCGYNSVAISCEQSGFASWSRDYWLSNRSNQLHNIADWLAEESRATGIPLTDISSSSAQGSGRGVCYHSELGSAGCGHSDPGAGFPLDKVLEWAKGGSGAEGQDMIPGVAVWVKDNKDYYAWVGKNGVIRYRGPDTDNKPVTIDSTAAATGGCDMAISDGGWTFVTFTNSSGDPYVLRRAPEGEGGWQRYLLEDV